MLKDHEGDEHQKYAFKAQGDLQDVCKLLGDLFPNLYGLQETHQLSYFDNFIEFADARDTRYAVEAVKCGYLIEGYDRDEVYNEPAENVVFEDSLVVIYYFKVFVIKGREEIHKDVDKEESVHEVVED